MRSLPVDTALAKGLVTPRRLDSTPSSRRYSPRVRASPLHEGWKLVLPPLSIYHGKLSVMNRGPDIVDTTQGFEGIAIYAARTPRVLYCRTRTNAFSTEIYTLALPPSATRDCFLLVLPPSTIRFQAERRTAGTVHPVSPTLFLRTSLSPPRSFPRVFSPRRCA